MYSKSRCLGFLMYEIFTGNDAQPKLKQFTTFRMDRGKYTAVFAKFNPDPNELFKLFEEYNLCYLLLIIYLIFSIFMFIRMVDVDRTKRPSIDDILNRYFSNNFAYIDITQEAAHLSSEETTPPPRYSPKNSLEPENPNDFDESKIKLFRIEDCKISRFVESLKWYCKISKMYYIKKY